MSRSLEVPVTTAYRPDIDGLRSIAVIPVLLYHAKVAPFSGGFVGVDVFFVISGYLIMGTLAADLRLGRFSVAGFYERRIKRIFPALFAVALFCLVGAAVTFPPVDLLAFGRSLMAMALFVSNLFFAASTEKAGYFAQASETQLLLHTWSLSVEEQFYILLPIGLLLVRRGSRRAMIAWIACLAALSFVASVWMTSHHPVEAFYSVFPRAWELLIGALLALGLAPETTRGTIARPIREVASVTGLLLIGYAVFTYSKETPFPGIAAIAPCLGAWLIILAGATGSSLGGSLLSTRPAVFVGKISYSLYLWHWPIVVFVKNLNTGKLNAPSTILIIASSFVAAYLSYRFVEQPFRRRRATFTRRRVLAAGVVASLSAVALGATLSATNGLPGRFPSATLSIVEANRQREIDQPPGSCENWKTTIDTMADIAFCPVGPASGKKILFWGDSHMGTLRPLVGSLYDEGLLAGRGAIFAIAASCPPDTGMDNVAAGYRCSAFARLALRRAAEPDIDAVFIAFYPWWNSVSGELCRSVEGRCVQTLSHGEATDLFLADLQRTIEGLRREGKAVILSLPAPSYNLFIPQKQINDVLIGERYRALQATGLFRRLKRNDYDALRDRLTALARETGATIYDPRTSLCHGDDCIYERQGVSLYLDDNHIANSQRGIFHDALAAALRRGLTR